MHVTHIPLSAVFENTRVFDVKDGEPCEVHTEQGVLRARDVISATHVPLGALTVTIKHTTFGLLHTA